MRNYGANYIASIESPRASHPSSLTLKHHNRTSLRNKYSAINDGLMSNVISQKYNNYDQALTQVKTSFADLRGAGNEGPTFRQ